MITIALFGAAGSMGTRITAALKDVPEYRMLYIEEGDVGQSKLCERGLKMTTKEEAVSAADVVILAVPDTLIDSVAADIVPALKRGTMLMCLDPAAPYAGKLPKRKDISYFVTHPSHPPLFNDETDPEARRDFFGNGKAKQSIVNALIQGPEEDYEKGEAIARKMFEPILRSHRITLEQMTMLEPVLTETVAATCITVVREAMDEAVRRGVPDEATRDFILGHISVILAILFDELDWEFSTGAKKAVEEAKQQLFKPDWKKVFEPENIMESVNKITEDE